MSIIATKLLIFDLPLSFASESSRFLTKEPPFRHSYGQALS
jgi:hypothetical protein